MGSVGETGNVGSAKRVTSRRWAVRKKERALDEGSVPIGNTLGFCNPRCQPLIRHFRTTGYPLDRHWLGELAGIVLVQSLENT